MDKLVPALQFNSSILAGSIGDSSQQTYENIFISQEETDRLWNIYLKETNQGHERQIQEIKNDEN